MSSKHRPTVNRGTAVRRRRCINCSFAVPRQQKEISLDELTQSTLTILKSWIEPTTINNWCILCVECYTLLQAHATSTIIPAPEFGHREVCFGCGLSILMAKSYKVSPECLERNSILRRTPAHQIWVNDVHRVLHK